jgi:hypothetical protein
VQCEDLVTGPDAVLVRIPSFLGVPERRRLVSHIQRRNAVPLEHRITNPAEIIRCCSCPRKSFGLSDGLALHTVLPNLQQISVDNPARSRYFGVLHMLEILNECGV